MGVVTFLEASSFEAFDLFSHTPGETIAPVLGADDGGAPVSWSFVEASFWSGLGLGESSARVVRGLGAGVEVGAAAPGISCVCWLGLVARATWSSTRWVRGLGAGVEIGAAAPEISCALGAGFGL